MSDDVENDEFEFPEENFEEIMNYLKEASELLKECPTEELCEKYKELFPPKFGMYIMSEERLSKLNNEMINDTLMHLVNEGLVEMYWDDTTNDFIFSAKDSLSGL